MSDIWVYTVSQALCCYAFYDGLADTCMIVPFWDIFALFQLEFILGIIIFICLLFFVGFYDHKELFDLLFYALISLLN